MTDHKRQLTWDDFVTALGPTTNTDFPPGGKERPRSPISATLISGEADTVLVDALLTVGQATQLADWVEAHGGAA